jgi:hypothetical protein
MAPYVRAGLPRFAAIIDQFNYYQENYWLPLKPPNGTPKEDWRSVVSRGNSPDGLLMASYYKQGIDRLLTSAQKKEAEDERQQIERCHPSALLGQAVLNEAKANPSAPELPQLLYKVVKLPRWSGESKTGSIYSRAALRMLKEHYPGDRWAKKVSCYY